ncbi:flagellar M-ring protein FliF [Solirubrobacter sp. CPCC 204708]|uniref:Flagellar M-ring protein n=1 Tax=Solirubrobacter deserti TaxID=2282478 RepID=A0ABT4RMW4_9ACTN|nr:flagellar basal-body MS-ring/collar protein FliF [Solirubrobacter deserti]MBE2316937.1 flagellar M-ring protein FliF [Solirubrobacter deserti]MDA0139768.1 flagellar basal-body MS-ring/collar protein FliF [Solirubrobacter deserti]
MPPFIQNILALPAKTKAILAVTAVAILAIAFIMLKIATAPAYSTIASGLDPAQTGKITAALDEQGIAYEIQNNGTALAVTKAQMPDARIALATAGVQATGGGTQPGYELLDESKLGASQFQQQVTYQRALEGEVAKTLQGVQGVQNPQVQIVMPQDDLFQDEATPATASVQLGNSSDALAPGAVRGMAQTVSSSVKGLKSENVTITDSTGAILWPSDEAGGATGGSSKQSAEARFARQKAAAINAMLDSTLGPGKAKVTVNADLNVDQSSEEKLVYGGTTVPLTETTEAETMEGAGNGNRGGAAGTGNNVPTYSGNDDNAAAGGGNYEKSTETRNNGVNKTITKTQKAPGTVNKMNVALLVDKSVPVDVFNALEQTVATAAGVDTTRGDTITATQMAFAKPAEPKAGPVPTTLLGPLKWVGLGLAALLFLFLMMRGMKKRENENLTPAWLTEIEEPVSLAALESGFTLDQASTKMLPPRAPDASLNQLDQLMEREPERVAAQVKAWMAED